jgi:catechol 2,3-dioxygenase
MSSTLSLEFAHAVVYVVDMEKILDFYTRVLGFEVTDRGPLGEREIVFLSQTADHHHQIAFVDSRNEAGRSNSVDHLAFRSSGSLAALRALHDALQAEPEVSGIRPLTHGNAWSVYFRDPEGNGIEVFIDTPWHVQQPQGKPLDFSMDDDALLAWTKEAFEADGAELSPLGEFYAARGEHLAQRSD